MKDVDLIIAVLFGILMAVLYFSGCSTDTTDSHPYNDCVVQNDSVTTCGETDFHIY